MFCSSAPVACPAAGGLGGLPGPCTRNSPAAFGQVVAGQPRARPSLIRERPQLLCLHGHALQSSLHFVHTQSVPGTSSDFSKRCQLARTAGTDSSGSQEQPGAAQACRNRNSHNQVQFVVHAGRSQQGHRIALRDSNSATSAQLIHGTTSRLSAWVFGNLHLQPPPVPLQA